MAVCLGRTIKENKRNDLYEEKRSVSECLNQTAGEKLNKDIARQTAAVSTKNST